MSELLEQIEQAARGAGSIMMGASNVRSTMMSKEGHGNFVTAYDRKVQEYLIAELSGILPEASFLGEEEGRQQFLPEYEKGWLFVIDPIDGTSNFSQGLFPSVTSIGLLKDGRPYIGVIYSPFSDQMFAAEKGKGAFENGVPIHTLQVPLKESLISFGTTPYDESMWDSSFEMARYYLNKGIDIRRSGSAAYDLCMVASGRTGLFCELRLQIYDYAAGALIVQEAGGTVTDPDGRPVSFRGPSGIVAVSQGGRNEDCLPPVQTACKEK